MTGHATKQRRLMIVVTAAMTAETFVFGLARNLAAEGLRVTVIADGLDPKSLSIGRGLLRLESVPMSRSPDPLRDLLSFWRLSRAIRRERPDMITFATPKASLLTSVAAWLLRVPCRIYQIWGLRLETTTGPARWFLAAMERITSSASTELLANSQSLSLVYESLGLNGRTPVRVFGAGSSHGVDNERFSRNASFGPVDDATRDFLGASTGLVVGFVGRLHPDKGLDTLLAAIRLLSEADLAPRVLIIGPDEGADLELDPILRVAVRFVGPIEDLRPYYAAMDVLVLPSRREGFPNVVLEAAAMETPAVVTDATGCVDSVVDGVTGVVVPVGDHVALAQALKNLDPALGTASALGRHARRWVVEQFAPDRIQSLWEQLIRDAAPSDCMERSE